MEKTFEELSEQFEKTEYPNTPYDPKYFKAATDVIAKCPLPNVYCFHVVLVAVHTDFMGYTSYVFKNLDTDDLLVQYIMCVRFPNWNTRTLFPGETGYVNVRYVKSGVDSWYNGNDFVPYKQNDIHFLNFVSESEDIELNGWTTQIAIEDKDTKLIENDEEE